MKTLQLIGFILLVVLAFWLGKTFSRHDRADLPPGMVQIPVGDELPPEKSHKVTIRHSVPTNDPTFIELSGIRDAVGRTPQINYEILSIQTFPSNSPPIAARIEVDGYLLFLCKDDGQWHVHRMANYSYKL
jgi:hypothetical protein